MISRQVVEDIRLTDDLIDDLDALNQSLERTAPEHILEWAWTSFGSGVVTSSSFQTQSVPLLHMVSQLAPEMVVLFIDTGFHFPETLAFRDRLTEQLQLNLKVVQPQIFGEDFLQIYGPLYQQNPDTCCFLNKVAPVQHELKNYKIWISGIRRDQTANRESSPIVGQHPFLPLVKVNPLVEWTEADVYDYIDAHGLPRHPLWEKGYRSIGCAPCTAPVSRQAHFREGRWPGSVKEECGIHIHKP